MTSFDSNSFAANTDWFVGIDSDGCAFDTMEVKHKECFIPATINHYGLQPVSKFAREAAEFVNLYSTSRGINRFPALIQTLELLAVRPEVIARGIRVTVPEGLVSWIQRETKLANPALEKAVAERGDPDLAQALGWSREVNSVIERVVHGVPPFPLVRESLEALSGKADVLVVSATPGEALQREWSEHDLSRHLRIICGQEAGTKKEILQVAKHYKPHHALMLGDAPGDASAAEANDALFFPILPGEEDSSWKRFLNEGLGRFFAQTFAGEYQETLLDEFRAKLPANPPWKQ